MKKNDITTYTKDLTTYTKAELIKALRASVAREAKLQKRIVTLEGMRAAPPPLHPDGVEPGPYDVVHVTQGPDTVSELVPPAEDRLNEAVERLEKLGGPEPLYQEDSSMVGPDDEDQAPPAFPWEKD